MEDVRVWWELAEQWALWTWQWLLQLPWQEWGMSAVWLLSVVFIWLLEMVVGIPAGLHNFFMWLSNPDVYGVLGNISTVVATLWLIANGHEYVFQHRLDRLAQLHENVQKMHRAMMSLQKQDTPENREKLAEARKSLKNHYFDYSMFLVEDVNERRHLQQLIKTLDHRVRNFSSNIVTSRLDKRDSEQVKKLENVRLAFKSHRALVEFTELLIDRRPWYTNAYRQVKRQVIAGVWYVWTIIYVIVRFVTRVVVWCLQPLWRPVSWIWWLVGKLWKHPSKVQKGVYEHIR